MMTLTIAALAGALILDGSVRAEARGGPTAGTEDPTSAGVSADLQGRLPDADVPLRFGLTPSAALAQGSQLFIRGFGEAGLRLGGGASARLRQAFGYGTIDQSPVAPGAGPGPVVPPAGRRFLQAEESNTSLEVDLPASRRLRMGGSAAWVVSGGADASSRASLPLSRGPQARAWADWSATRRDTLRVELHGLDARYSNDRRASLASFTAGWRTEPSRGAELALSIGPGIGRSEASDRHTTLVYAVGTADVRASPWRDLTASVGAAVEPLGDPLSGEVVERGSLRASAAWGRTGGVVVAARLIGSVAVTSGSGGITSPRSGDRYLQAELSATLPLDARSTLTAGARAAFLSRPVLDQPSGQWIAFVGYGLQFPLVR